MREFAEQRVAPVAEELDRESRFPYELIGELAELGLMGMTIPEEYGGAGTDTVSYAIAVEELTRMSIRPSRSPADPPLARDAADLLLPAARNRRRSGFPTLHRKKLAAFGLTRAGCGLRRGRDANARGVA